MELSRRAVYHYLVAEKANLLIAQDVDGIAFTLGLERKRAVAADVRRL